mmetsp:Transcript_18271/g.42600  ORF Transcript_18271/g.42600 Transcript_18271/m.42600 type:complete len:143 (+) Transcript_18271:113-541(+)
MERHEHSDPHRGQLELLAAPVAGIQSAAAVLEVTNHPRALFRLRIILSHLGMNASELQVQDWWGPPALPYAAHAGSEERALLPWPLTDTLGQHLDHLLHEVSTKVLAYRRPLATTARHLPQPPRALQRAEQRQEVERWWPAL